MGKIKILILGDSRVLPRKWENKESYFEPKLLSRLNSKYNAAEFDIRTIAQPNKLVASIEGEHNIISEFSPDIVLFNLNLCDFIPRSLPKYLFDKLERYSLNNPRRAETIRGGLARHRRMIHRMVGKNAWNSLEGYRKDLESQLTYLKSITKNVVFFGCLKTSESSEHIRPGFQKDIQRFNHVSSRISEALGVYYLDLNSLLEKTEYSGISHDGIHYTDNGDDLIVDFVFENILKGIVDNFLADDFSIEHPKKPNYIQVELTNYCSVKCTMCELNSSNRSKGYMTDEVFSKLISDLVEWGIPMVRFTLWGEALMHPKFFEFVKKAKSKGLQVGFNTNGILLTEEIIQKLIKLGLDQIVFSVDSIDNNEIYRKFRPGTKSIDQINQIILKLLEHKELLNVAHPEVMVQMIGTDQNLDQHEKFLSFWGPRVNFCRITHLYSMSKLKYNSSTTKEHDYFYECKYPWTTMGVYHDGSVTACCRDVDGKLKLGNILNNSLEEIYHSRFQENMRRNLVEGNKEAMPKFCQNCFKYTLIQ